MVRKFGLAVFAFVVLLSFSGWGCQAPEMISEAPASERRLEGKPLADLAGSWKTEDGKSTYTLRADGTYDFDGKVTTRGQTFDNKFSGEWRVNGEEMLFSDPQKNVSAYSMKREGDALTLTLTGSMKRELKLKRSAQ